MGIAQVIFLSFLFFLCKFYLGIGLPSSERESKRAREQESERARERESKRAREQESARERESAREG